ncbi:hypothetical protein, partial [Streptomyces shenzhenensis]|uniref:hypothetical protein n=1 Tax=Streptomyces shenzhenensis TaxID=943815 RepID=UPI001C68D4A2
MTPDPDGGAFPRSAGWRITARARPRSRLRSAGPAGTGKDWRKARDIGDRQQGADVTEFVLTRTGRPSGLGELL